MHNVAKATCKETNVQSIITDAASLVRHLKKTGLNYKNNIRVKSYCSTRWNTVYTMLNSIVENYQSIYTSLEQRQSSGKRKYRNSLERIERLKKSTLIKIVKFLKPFKEWTDEIEGDKNVTLFQVWPTFIKLNEHLRMLFDEEQEDDNDFQLIEAMKSFGRKYVSEISDDITPKVVHRMATVLHPGMRKLRRMNPDERDDIYEKIDTIVRDGESTRVQTKSPKITKNFLDDFIDLEDSFTEETAYSNEFSKYLQQKISNEELSDLCKWWFQNRATYPNLYKLFLRISCIPSSSAPSERTFSISGAVITDRRSSLLPKSVKNQMLCRNLYRV